HGGIQGEGNRHFTRAPRRARGRGGDASLRGRAPGRAGRPGAPGSAAVAVGVTGEAVLDAVPGVTDRGLGLGPAQPGLAAGPLPAALQLGLRLRRPAGVRARGARLGAVAVGRAVVVEAEGVGVVVGLAVAVGVVAVGVLVGAEGAVGAVVGVLHRGVWGLPVLRRLAAGLRPAFAQLRLGLAPVAPAFVVAVVGAEAVGRRIVAVEVAVALVVLALGGAFAPVLDFGRRGDALGDGLAAGRAADRAHAAADQGTDRAEDAAHGRACDGARGAAGGDAHRMRARGARDRVAVGVGLVVTIGHGVLLLLRCG